jgi:hypothetical protein
MSFSVESVLAHLEACYREPYRFFVDLSHGYFFNATTRLHVFADRDRWAMVFETAGYGNRTRSMEIELFHFGNCLLDLPRAGLDGLYECNMQTVELVDVSEMERIEEELEWVPLSGDTVTVRGRCLDIPADPTWFEEMGMQVRAGRVPLWSLVCYLAAEYPDSFKASNVELRRHVPADLPQLLSIHEWHHRQYYVYADQVLGDPPSSYETYPMLAEVMASGEPRCYQSTLPPNTHWSNWPGAGSL